MRHLILIIAVFYSFSLVSQNSEKKDKMMVTLITRAPKLENSIDFYKKLAFKQLPKPTFKTVAQQEAPRAEAVFFTDGKMVIEVSADIFVRAGLKMYKKSWASEISKLEAITKVFKTKDGYLLYDPSGIAIYLVEYEFNVDFIPADSAFSHLGNYQGLTVESPDIEKAFKVYENLGFKLKMGEAAKGFVGLVSPDNFTVTLLAPANVPAHVFQSFGHLFQRKK